MQINQLEDLIYQDENYFYLYKHLKCTENTIKVLTEGTISYTTPEKFNDPFDCIYEVSEDYHYTATELGQLEQKYDLNKTPPAKRIIENKKVKFQLNRQIEDGSYFKEIHKGVGICCLNHNPLEILMWSHYADHHKGFMIELRFPKSSNYGKLGNFIPMSINYANSMPMIDRSDRVEYSKTQIIQKVYLTKHTSWSYEKEYRVILTGILNNILPYPRDELLCSVIMGINISRIDQAKVENALKSIPHNVSLFRAKRLSGQYALTVPNHPRLDVLAKLKKKK